MEKKTIYKKATLIIIEQCLTFKRKNWKIIFSNKFSLICWPVKFCYGLILTEQHWSCFLNAGECCSSTVRQRDLILQCGAEHMLTRQHETRPQDLELQMRKSTTILVLLANPKSWPSKASSFCDVGIWVGSYWDAWKTPIPNERHKGLHGGIVGIGLAQGCPSLENLA